jgi:histidyl-tRNA synthetase
LRYDLIYAFCTLRAASNEIEFPLKRYQIQPVLSRLTSKKDAFESFFNVMLMLLALNPLWQEIELVRSC